MPARKERFDFEEHMLAGDILRKAESDLVLLAMAAHEAYGKGLFGRIMRLAKAAAEIRTALDSRVSAEHPRSVDMVNGVRITNIYFGAREDVPIRDVQGAPHDFRAEFRRRAGLVEISPEEKRAGRPRALDAARLAQAREMLAQPNRTIEGVAAELGIAASTLYRYVPGGRSAVLSGAAAERE
ncbi:helix-turn-helix domain-containing protein [Ferrovibrio terrae]|uniref:helix-turn-helix domain-containing protein n=1 Tax=Ferrovibrio terrae TaxID=2594003 RepID=UPI003137FD71